MVTACSPRWPASPPACCNDGQDHRRSVARPAYRIKVGDKDITGRFQNRLIELTLADNSGFEADQLDIDIDIELDDSDGKLDLPEKGVRLSLSLGWEDAGLVLSRGLLRYPRNLDVWAATIVSAARQSCLTLSRRGPQISRPRLAAPSIARPKPSLRHKSDPTLQRKSPQLKTAGFFIAARFLGP